MLSAHPLLRGSSPGYGTSLLGAAIPIAPRAAGECPEQFITLEHKEVKHGARNAEEIWILSPKPAPVLPLLLPWGGCLTSSTPWARLPDEQSQPRSNGIS